MSELTFSEEEERYIKNRFSLTNDQLEIFLSAAKRYGLNPISNHIYPQVRGKGMTIMTGIDGFRLVADRSGNYAGNDDPLYDSEQKPTRATVSVYKIVNGERCAFTASARWDQYFPGEKQGFMWKKMPHLMLGKCAESLALRKAFPAELSGLYTKEEMEQADAPDNATVEVEPPTPQRAVPDLVSGSGKKDPETDHKAQFIHMINIWSDAETVTQGYDNARIILGQLGIPTDGSATDANFKTASEFMSDRLRNNDNWSDYAKPSSEESEEGEIWK